MAMKLAAIWNVWHDFDLLEYSVKSIESLVDGIAIVASTRSNFGEVSPIPKEWIDRVIVREPHFNIPMHSETDKRNYGLDYARRAGYTHFVMLDADECYHKDQFQKAKERFLNEPKLQGLVCPCNVYFKSPTLTIGRDITLVPFIHKITPTLKFEFNSRYPFAFDRNGIRIDPTRQLNINDIGVEYTEDVVMEHFSWCRQDYALKIRNSTARKNLERSTILTDLSRADDGFFVDFYQKRLTRCKNLFGIPEYDGERIIL